MTAHDSRHRQTSDRATLCPSQFFSGDTMKRPIRYALPIALFASTLAIAGCT